MKPIKNLLNNLTNNNKSRRNNNKNNNNNKNKRRVTININNIKNTRRRGNGRPKNRKIAAANIRNMNRDFKILYQDGTTVKVTGRDLVYKIPSDLTANYANQVITLIPANPCYWLGTRIAALAQGYQNYRPLNMKFTYIPQVAVTQQGNVICGTLWNQAPSNDNIQQSLRTSNGGMLSQCYKSFTSVVRMKSNLQFNLYKTAGTFDQESNPFIFMAMGVGTVDSNGDQLVPGYFYVTWSFLLKNPIGNTNVYANSGITRWIDIKNNDNENQTIVFLTADDGEIPQGAILQMDYDEDNNIYVTYNGSHYEMEDNDKVWYFANSSIQQINAVKIKQKPVLFYNRIIPINNPATDIETQIYFRTSEQYTDNYLLYLFPEPRIVTTDPARAYYYLEGRITQYADSIIGMFLGTFDGFQTFDNLTGYRASINIIDVDKINIDDPQSNKQKLIQTRNIRLKTTKQKQITANDKSVKINNDCCNKNHKIMKPSHSDKYYTNISPIFELA